jgi:hypothetical protein
LRDADVGRVMGEEFKRHKGRRRRVTKNKLNWAVESEEQKLV